MTKTCVICGEDCSGRPRTKDARGRYYCLTCYQQAKHSLEQKQAASAPTPTADPRADPRAAPRTAPPNVPPDVPSDDPSVFLDLLDGVLDQSQAVHDSPQPTLVQAAPPPTPVQVTPRRSERSTQWVGLLSSRKLGLCLFAVIFVAVMALGDFVTVLFFLFVALAVINGYWIGAARIGALLGGLLAGVLLGIPLGKALEGLCAAVFHLTGTTNRMTSIALCVLASVVLVTIILRIVIARWQKRNPQWERYDRLAGSGLGLLQGALLGLLLFWAVLSLEPIAITSLAQTQSPNGPPRLNPVSRQVVALAQAARSSKVGRFADTINPFNQMRLITLLANGLIVINDPQAQQAFINHPAIKEIQQRPSVQQAMQMLADDEEISDILENGSMAQSLRTLLASPTLLAIFDQTDIVADLSPLTDGIERAINEAMEHKTR